MNKDNDSGLETENAATSRSPLLTKSRIIAAALGLGGMVIGSIVGMGVQLGVESTGLLGPSVESLIAEQQSNFTDVNARLDELRKMSTDKEVKASLTELAKLLARQDELAKQASAELSYLGDQVAEMRQAQLAESGFAGGADFWLKAGESVNVGTRNQVFGLLGARATFADVNLSGTRKRIAIGDAVAVPGDEKACTVFYKQATPRPDGRVGFDITCG
jgi:hypothetical protein